MNRYLSKLSLVTLLPSILLSSCSMSIRTNSDKSTYQDTYQKYVLNGDFHSELYIFPSEVNIDSIVDFKAMERDSIFTGDYLLYLVMKYDFTSYQNEINRLANIYTYFNRMEARKDILHLEESHAYISIYTSTKFEYAIYNSETLEIAYISNQLFTNKDIELNEKYILKDINIPEDRLDTFGNEKLFNIYYYYEGDIGYYVKD